MDLRLVSSLCIAFLVLTTNGVTTGGPAFGAVVDDPTCAVPVTGTPSGASGPSTTGYVLNVGGSGDFGTVWDPPQNPQLAFPGVFGADLRGADSTPVRGLFVSAQTSLDRGDVLPTLQGLVSSDGGMTFPASSLTDDPPPRTVTRLRDGTLLGYSFRPVSAAGATATFQSFRSVDDGRTWTTGTATFRLGSSLAPGSAPRTHGSVLELADGTILVSVYAAMAYAPTTFTSQVEASTDGGLTFTRRGVIATANATNSYPEAAIAQLPGGGLLSVVRHHSSASPITPDSNVPAGVPLSTTSSDGGVTWAAPRALDVSFPHGYDPYDDATGAVRGISPQLRLLPNGVMVLSSGRPDNWLAISTNGLGTGWVGQLTYRNCPTSGYRLHGSTGNTGLEIVGSNRVIQIGDNCENTWACDEPEESGFTVDRQNRIWKRFADVLTPDVGKIDLATKYRRGQLTVTGDLTWTSSAHPRAGVDGAFDGSTEYWSSAVGGGDAGTYVIRLDRRYDLTRIGLSLHNGRLATGRVYTSTDGVTWGSPVVSAADRTHYALEYFALPTPVAARYVRVEVDPAADCPGQLGASCAFLNELELYSTVDSFENDPVNNRARGYTEQVSSWVTRADTDGSSRALRISDSSESAQAKAVRTGTSGSTKTLEFRLKPVTLPNGFLFDVLGRNSSGTRVTSYHFGVFPNGVVRRWNGSSWVAVTPASTVPTGVWSTIRVTAGLKNASVQVNGVSVATSVTPSAGGATSLHGHAFASAGTTMTGDNVVVDDVLFTP